MPDFGVATLLAAELRFVSAMPSSGLRELESSPGTRLYGEPGGWQFLVGEST